MAVGNYLGVKAERQVIDRVRRAEEMHIATIPEGEREEIRQIFASKGFQGNVLEEIVSVITQDRKRWVDTMLTEEFGLRLDSPSPAKASLATFSAFALAGLVPLLPFVFSDGLPLETTFTVSAAATACTFFAIGAMKGRIVHRSWLLAGLEALSIGGAAALLAYAVGVLLGPK
jgi:VIT1/CCC1 family predicted Fe2+/Mn2+ transporter